MRCSLFKCYLSFTRSLLCLDYQLFWERPKTINHSMCVVLAAWHQMEALTSTEFLVLFAVNINWIRKVLSLKAKSMPSFIFSSTFSFDRLHIVACVKLNPWGIRIYIHCAVRLLMHHCRYLPHLACTFIAIETIVVIDTKLLRNFIR